MTRLRVGSNPFDGLRPETVELISGALGQHPELLLQIDWVRGIVAEERVKAYATDGTLRTTGADPDQATRNTLAYNLDALRSGGVLHRPMQLINPVRAIERIHYNTDRLTALSVGPRSELEVFSLHAAGFRPENVKAIDLISYSPLVDLGDMHRMPYDDHAFDVVFVGWTMGYSKDLAALAREIVRVSRDRAIIAIGNDFAVAGEDTSAFGGEYTEFRSVDALLAPFGDRIGQVYFRHEPDNPDVMGKGQLMVVFELLKDGAPLTAALDERAVDRANPRRPATQAPVPAPDDAVDLRTVALTTSGFYALAKLLATPREEAQALVEILNLSALDASAPPLDPERFAPFLQQSPDNRLGAGLGFAGAAGESFAKGDFATGIRQAQATALILVDLMETGNIVHAMTLCHGVLNLVRTRSSWDPVTLATALAGSLDFLKTGTPKDWAHYAHVALYCQSNGMFQQLLGWLVGSQFPAPPPAAAETGTILGLGGDHPVERVVETMRRDSYFQFEPRIPGEVCDRLTEFALKARGAAQPPEAVPNGRASFAERTPELEGIWFDLQDALDQPDVQDLIADPDFLTVARGYLGCEPLFHSANIWWSFPQAEASTGMAQLYHFDPDLNRTVHFFIYLTDVDASGGPHAYVAGSHRAGTKPASFIEKLQRIPDAAVEQAYGRDRLVTACGPRGTILAGDTKAWHKGINPTARPRLMLQLLFVDTMTLAKPVEDLIIRPSFTPRFLDFVRRHPQVFAPRCRNLRV